MGKNFSMEKKAADKEEKIFLANLKVFKFIN